MLEQFLHRQQIEQAQQAIRAQQQSSISIAALGRIIAHNQQQNALIQAAVKPKPDPNAEPPRVTVQDIFDYHLLKDNCVYCQKPHRPCPIH